jgi:hypothetical protein
VEDAGRGQGVGGRVQDGGGCPLQGVRGTGELRGGSREVKKEVKDVSIGQGS